MDKDPVLMYFIENMAFAFDVLDKIDKQDKWILAEAAINEEYSLKDLQNTYCKRSVIQFYLS